MIYIDNDIKIIKIFRHYNEKLDKIVLRNNVSGNIYEFNLQLVKQGNLINEFEIENIESLPVGEYCTELKSGDSTIEKCLLTFGNFEKTINKEYQNEQTTIIYGE